MKDDVEPLPDAVPKKRAQIRQILDMHLAMWLAPSSGITPLERRKLSAEKERRKTVLPDVKLGVIMGSEGMTPNQFRTFQRVLPQMGATEVHHPTLPGKVYHVIKSLGVPIHVRGDIELYDPQAMIRDCTVVIAAPKELKVQSYSNGLVWGLIGYAKHRSLPVKIILPDGKEVQ